MCNDILYSIIEKNDDFSWDEIRSVILKAHQENLSRGLVVSTTKMSVEQQKKQLGEGICFLAVKERQSEREKAGEIIGVAALKIHNINTWYAKGPVAHFMFDAVLPEYKGHGIYRKLFETRYDYVRNHSASCITISTAEKNFRMRTILDKQGFCPVRMFSVPGLNHYSIRWVKWLCNKPYPSCYIKFRYACSRFYTKIRFTSNHSKRFGI